MKLVELQGLFWSAVRAKQPPAGLSAAFVGGESLNAVKRMQIYRAAYWARHERCLREAFPRLLASVGDAQFRRWVAQYIEQCPSRVVAIERVGERFAWFVNVSAHPSAELLSDVARLEWARLEVLLAADARSALDPRTLGVDAASQNVRLSPTVVLRRVRPEALSMLHAEVPAVINVPDTDRVWVAVWRGRGGAQEVQLDEREGRALERGLRGETLADVCSELDADDGHDAVERAFAAIGRWIARGWIEALEESDEEKAYAT